MQEPPDQPAPPDPAADLLQVTDDSTHRHEAARWAEEQLLTGRSPEDLAQELTTEGWDAEEAGQIAEQARKETRAQRGILTRNDVIRDMNLDYRRATGGLSVAFRSGLFGLYGFTTGFMAALRSLRKLKHISKKQDTQEP